MSTNRTWTHVELVNRAARWLRNSAQVSDPTSGNRPITAHWGVVLTEPSGSGTEIPDAIGWSHGGMVSIVIECKTSRADFRSDFQKVARRSPQFGVGNYRFYMAPVGVIAREALTEMGWGLLEVSGRVVRIVQQSREHNYSLRRQHAMLWSALRKQQ